jgi:hypothetical protein
MAKELEPKDGGGPDPEGDDDETFGSSAGELPEGVEAPEPDEAPDPDGDGSSPGGGGTRRKRKRRN